MMVITKTILMATIIVIDKTPHISILPARIIVTTTTIIAIPGTVQANSRITEVTGKIQVNRARVDIIKIIRRKRGMFLVEIMGTVRTEVWDRGSEGTLGK